MVVCLPSSFVPGVTDGLTDNSGAQAGRQSRRNFSIPFRETASLPPHSNFPFYFFTLFDTFTLPIVFLGI